MRVQCVSKCHNLFQAVCGPPIKRPDEPRGQRPPDSLVAQSQPAIHRDISRKRARPGEHARAAAKLRVAWAILTGNNQRYLRGGGRRLGRSGQSGAARLDDEIEPLTPGPVPLEGTARETSLSAIQAARRSASNEYGHGNHSGERVRSSVPVGSRLSPAIRPNEQ
jgi:hypothetical protein